MRTPLGEIWADDALNVVTVKVYYAGEMYAISAAGNLGLDTALVNALVELTGRLVDKERRSQNEVDE